MPLYFAYGSNMDAAAMAKRCPHARALGPARLARHRFFIMAEGYASIARDRNAEVHGVLYDLAFSDIGPLDRYEEVLCGLYVKMTQPILRLNGGSTRALVYIGRCSQEGDAAPDYMGRIVSAAKDWSLPLAYVAFLETQLKPARRARGA